MERIKNYSCFVRKKLWGMKVGGKQQSCLVFLATILLYLFIYFADEGYIAETFILPSVIVPNN